jgi:hypothetical protein
MELQRHLLHLTQQPLSLLLHLALHTLLLQVVVVVQELLVAVAVVLVVIVLQHFPYLLESVTQ